MKQIEYKVENIQVQLKGNKNFSEVMEERLNSLGEEGWELAGINGTIFYFKRDLN